MKTRVRYVLLALCIILLSGCQTKEVAPLKVDLEKNQTATSSKLDLINTFGTSALNLLEDFVSKHPKREAGSDNEASAAVYLHDVLQSYGYDLSLESFDYTTSWAGKLSSQNVIAKYKPEAKRRILIGAHYDSMPSGDGADDNASGVVALLTVANQVSHMDLGYGIDFVLFGSEEAGLKGSSAYHDAHDTDIELMINLDSLIAGDFLYIYGESEKSVILKRALEIATQKQLPIITQNEKASGLPYGTTLDASDHAVFKNSNVPILYFEATNWSIGKHDGYTQTSDSRVSEGEIWHSTQDTLPFITATFPNRAELHLSATIDLLLTVLQTEAWH